MITISQLWTYPFKSAKGVSVDSIQVNAKGLENDRHLVALDANGHFLTARKHTTLLQLSCIKNNDGWQIEHPNHTDTCQINQNTLHSTIKGQVWNDDIQALDAGDEAAAWLSEIMQLETRIAIWQKKARHSEKYQLETHFSDAAPILIASESSTEQACQWGSISTDIRRFRPNIVLTGSAPFAEDAWQQLRIGNLDIKVLDACSRCILTTVDPDTSIRHPDRQPMKALMEHHSNQKGQPLFGMNVVAQLADTDYATLKVGDSVEVIT